VDIHNKRLILTGAASGIGAALLTQLAAYNTKIVAVDLNPLDIPTANENIYSYTADLTQPQQIDALFEFALEKMGRVDIFIANAGFAYYEKIGLPDWEHIERIYRLNVFSPIYTLQKMHTINPSNPYCVVMTASAMAKWALPGYALYSSTKAALDSFADAYRFELEPNGRLMLVYPIATCTNFFKAANDSTPVPWPTQSPEIVAQAVIRGIERNRNAVFPSALFHNIWRLGHVLPGLKGFYQIMQNQTFQRWIKSRN
jgi:uncharacterized protein